MKIHVTDRHIENGQRNSSSCCAIALAIKEADSNLVFNVGTGYVCFTPPDRFTDCPSVDLPLDAVRFIYRFDEGLPVQPFEFELPVTTFAEASQ